MIAKELRGIWWKIVLAVAGAVPAGLIVAAYLPPYETTNRTVERLSDEAALGQILNVYEGGGVALSLLAILLGAATVSGETSRGTIFLLLSKPISRARILLTKYAISAGVLIAAAVSGHAMLIAAAVARGYPTGLLSPSGVVLSTILIWLGSLSVLGMAATFSILFGDVLVSVAATFVTVFLCFYALPWNAARFVSRETLESVAPLYSWASPTLYAGEGLALPNFLACAAVAAGLLLLSLRMFGRRGY